MLLALLGATAGQGVVWYTGQFYALFFLTITLKVDYLTAYTLIGISLLIGTPFFIFFGWLSDRCLWVFRDPTPRSPAVLPAGRCTNWRLGLRMDCDKPHKHLSVCTHCLGRAC